MSNLSGLKPVFAAMVSPRTENKKMNDKKDELPMNEASKAEETNDVDEMNDAEETNEGDDKTNGTNQGDDKTNQMNEVNQTNQGDDKTNEMSKTNAANEDTINVFWDYDSCPLPANTKMGITSLTIYEYAKELTNNVSVTLYATSDTLKNSLAVLDRAASTMSLHIDGDRKVLSDSIAKALNASAETKSHTVVITNCFDYETQLRNIDKELLTIITTRSAPNYANTEDWFKFTSNLDEKTFCKHFNNNVCDYSKTCKFRHACKLCGSSTHGRATCSMNDKKIICEHFARGDCKYGDRCKLAHDTKMKITFEVCPDTFFCKFGKSCPKYHDENQKAVFAKNNGVGMDKRKIAYCKSRDKCTRSDCTFAHKLAEIVCFKCTAKGEHMARDCPKQRG